MADPETPTPAAPPKPVHIGGETILDRLLPHLKKIVVGAILIAVVVTIVFGVRWWKQRGHEEQTEKLAQALAVAQRPIAVPGAPPDAANPAFTDAKERAKAVLDELSKQGAEPPGAAYRAGLLLAAGNIDEAITAYRAGQAVPGIEGVLAREGLGIALEAKAAAQKEAAQREPLLKEALAAFQAMQPDEKGPRHVYAVYHQARLHAALGNAAEAKKLFEKANELIASQPRHELREHLSKRLAALGAA